MNYIRNPIWDNHKFQQIQDNHKIKIYGCPEFILDSF